MNTPFPLILLLLLICGATTAQKTTIGLTQGFGLSAHQRITDRDYGINFPVRPVFSTSSSIQIGHFLNKKSQILVALGLDIKGVDRYIINHYYYAAIPVNYRLYFSPDVERWNGFIQGGLYCARLLRHTQRFVEDRPVAEEYIVEWKDPYPYDFGAQIAGGLTYTFSNKWSLDIGCNISHGFRNLYQVEPAQIQVNKTANIAALFTTTLNYSL